MNHVRSRFGIIQCQVMAVLFFLGAIAGLIVALRNKNSVLLLVVFLVLAGVCLLLCAVSIYCAVRPASKS